MATNTARATGIDRRPRHRDRRHPMVAIATTIFVASVAAIAGLVATDQSQTTLDREPSGEIIERLVNQGLVPRQTLDGTTEDRLTADLANQGLVPRQTLDGTTEDRLTTDLANQGLVPRQTLDGTTEDRLTTDLANQGLIPPEARVPAAK